jgi:hypothetical protein
MRDQIAWLPCAMATEKFGKRTVYVKHYIAPFVGAMVAADTAFTVPAFIRIRGKHIRGFITPADGMAYMQEHGASHFVAFTNEEAKL